MKFSDEITIGDKYRPAMKITDQEEADKYFKACVEHTMRFNEQDRLDAERIERISLGYYAGYYNHETRIRVEELFGCKHPLCGKAKDGVPSPEEALEMGMAAGGE